jgi:hypothetical protein
VTQKCTRVDEGGDATGMREGVPTSSPSGRDNAYNLN